MRLPCYPRGKHHAHSYIVGVYCLAFNSSCPNSGLHGILPLHNGYYQLVIQQMINIYIYVYINYTQVKRKFQETFAIFHTKSIRRAMRLLCYILVTSDMLHSVVFGEEEKDMTSCLQIHLVTTTQIALVDDDDGGDYISL